MIQAEFADDLLRENERLASLYVAASQLHSTLDPDEVQQIIVEILLNFVGAKVFALMAPVGDGTLAPLLTEGVDPEIVPARLAGAAGGLIGDVFAGHPAYVASAPTPARAIDREPLVVIPLRVRLAGRPHVVAVIAVWEFLQQKHELTDVDAELFTLLSESAGVALEAALCAQKAGQGPHVQARPSSRSGEEAP
jgi:GAF domain-containing protein